jgi:hypothetical protein
LKEAGGVVMILSQSASMVATTFKGVLMKSISTASMTAIIGPL